MIFPADLLKQRLEETFKPSEIAEAGEHFPASERKTHPWCFKNPSFCWSYSPLAS
jgi:hypothetical protein